MKKLLAFTLAETLIVIGIIGVVSALTLPNLNSSTGEKEKVAKVKKIYQNLDDAVGRAIAVYGPFEEWFVNDTTAEAGNKRFAERLTEFLKISKSCGTSVGSCFSDKLKLSRYAELVDTTDVIGSYYYSLADGTSIAMYVFSDDWICSDSNLSGSNVCATINVDIDGRKGANEFGKDIFWFNIYKINNQYVVYPNLGNPEDGPISGDVGEKGSYTEEIFPFMLSTLWIIEQGNMDYLKVDSNGKCPNGTVLSWTNTSCK